MEYLLKASWGTKLGLGFGVTRGARCRSLRSMDEVEMQCLNLRGSPARTFVPCCFGSTYRLLSSSFSGLYLESSKVNPERNY